MRTRNKLFGLIAIAIIAIIGCKDEPEGEQPQVHPPTTRDLSFGTDCKVTITSADTFTVAEWTVLCDKVVTAINGKYSSAPGSYPVIFASAQNTKVILGNNFTYNWEVKTDEYRTAYIKTSSVETVNFTEILEYMEVNYPGNG